MVKINPHLEKLIRVLPAGNRKDCLRLDMNENPEGLPQEFVEECFSRMDGEFLARYPDTEVLLDTLCEYHGISKEWFCISDGSEMAMKYLFEGFVASGGNIVSFAPTFAMYGVYARMFGVEHREVPIASDFSLPVDKLIEQVDNETSLIVLLVPNNPVGGVMDEASIRCVIQAAREHNALVVIDEAYHYFCDVSYLKLVGEYDNVMVLRTFSKMFSLASCRVGYAVGNPGLIKVLYKVRPTFDTNAIGLFLANEILHRQEIIQQLIETERKGKRFLLEELEECGYHPYDGEGNYVLLKPCLPPMVVEERLREERILIKTYENPLLRDYIRVSTGSRRVMRQFLETFLRVDKNDAYEK